MIDYAKLLAKYMALVGQAEGTYFIERAPWISEEEYQVLKEASLDALQYTW